LRTLGFVKYAILAFCILPAFYVHVRGRVPHELLDALDDHEPRQEVAVERVKEEQPARPEHTRRFGHDGGG